MGTIIGDQTPTAEDILDSTNKALEKMTQVRMKETRYNRVSITRTPITRMSP